MLKRIRRRLFSQRDYYAVAQDIVNDAEEYIRQEYGVTLEELDPFENTLPYIGFIDRVVGGVEKALKLEGEWLVLYFVGDSDMETYWYLVREEYRPHHKRCSHYLGSWKVSVWWKKEDYIERVAEMLYEIDEFIGV